MSQASIDLVGEFFNLNNFFVLRYEDVFLIKNTLRQRCFNIENFSILLDDIPNIKTALIKTIPWHTVKFSPSVLQKNPEIFKFIKKNNLKFVDKVFQEIPYLKILIIPDLPVTPDLREKSISIMKDEGITNIITFPTIITGLIDKIEPRKMYTSIINEMIRILKFYEFFAKNEQNLPF